ncbi:hypothetical protein Pint_32951 [Pistacia integerrima]|uniref:Uncharacterized protein n=1 Tax=Pistacia integerrima TaxID=434235 RepID=A0ACC0X5S7_9ROSI|nr:hypothetical protein Pint_32951 [Pistacia integerrima]
MTRQKSIFRSMDDSVRLKVQLGDCKAIQIEGKGTIVVKPKSSIERLIHDVYFFPSLAHNLLSVGQLIRKRYLVFFYNDVCEIKTSERIIAKVHMTGSIMFPFELLCLEDYALVANVNDSDRLWHLRYGHLHFNGLTLLSQKKYGVKAAIYCYF